MDVDSEYNSDSAAAVVANGGGGGGRLRVTSPPIYPPPPPATTTRAHSQIPHNVMSQGKVEYINEEINFDVNISLPD